MLSTNCVQCAKVYRVVLSHEFPEGVSGTCACGSATFSEIRLTDTDQGDTPTIGIGVHHYSVDRQRIARSTWIVSDGETSIALNGDLSWGETYRSTDDVIKAMESWNLRELCVRDPLDPVMDDLSERTGMGLWRTLANPRDYRIVAQEFDRFPGTSPLLVRVLTDILAYAHALSPRRERPELAVSLEHASKIAFLVIDAPQSHYDHEGWTTAYLMSGDYRIRNRYTLRRKNPGGYLLDDPEIRFQKLAEDLSKNDLKVYASDWDRECIETAARTAEFEIPFRMGSTESMLSQTWETVGREVSGTRDNFDYPSVSHRRFLGRNLGWDEFSIVRLWRACTGEPPASPVIFIDIDGALVPWRAHLFPSNSDAMETIVKARQEAKTRGSRHSLRIADLPPSFDPVAIAMLNRLATLADARFVISSNWLLHRPWGTEKTPTTQEQVRDVLIRNGLEADRFHIDYTVPKRKGDKQPEIHEWLAEHPEVGHWITIEDDAWRDDRVVRCSIEDGMTLEVYRSACEALGVEDDLLSIRAPRRRKTRRSGWEHLFL
jgi:hypothetical protein